MTGVEFVVAGWFAIPLIKTVVDKADNFLSDNYELQIDTKKMVKELTIALLVCEAAITEVKKKAIINNRGLADWLRKLKDTVCDAEDVLDNMEAKYIKEKVQGKKKVSEHASSPFSVVWNTFFSDDNLKRLKKVVDDLNQFSDRLPVILRLVEMNIYNESHTREVTTVPIETISQQFGKVGLYGREDELNKILDIILGSESESSKKEGHGLLVIPIVGMGGVGKTTLAQAIYNNSVVQQNFASKAWISVSNKLDVDAISVMREISQSLGFSSPGSIKLQGFFTNMALCLGKVGKFLIVLDKMFEMSEREWKSLYETLSLCVPGSVVLITTQNQVFGKRVGTFCPIALSPLDSDVFWELFEHYLFGNEEIPDKNIKNLKSIGKKIAQKLRGLPLAAKIIGNLLRTNVDEEKWRKILKSEWWYIPEGKSCILPSINLGYTQLKPSLRQCFAYCSVFPRKSLIEKDRLVHMWIAQNFIQSDDDGMMMNLEDIGRQWFDELVEKSFFQRAGDNDSYVMHELMHDLAVINSSSECFYLGEGLVKIPLGVRHLAIDTHNVDVMKAIRTPKNLRSFLYVKRGQVEGMYSAINNTLSNLDSIRVLDLSDMCMENEKEPPNNIWKLQHLRFLDLSSTGIKHLTPFSIFIKKKTPSSIILHHLQALYIRKCEFLELRSSIHKLINLRHLCADEKIIAQVSGIGQLTNLQELGVFVVGNKKGHKITELGNLREIRGTLRIENFENIENKDEAMLANLVDKKHLDSICIYSSTTKRPLINIDMEVLAGLQPHKDIKDLRINCYIGSYFPNWIVQIGDFLNLNTLHLVSCVNVEVLPPLGELPSLKQLQIKNFGSVKLIDSTLYGEKQTVFPLLEELVFDTLPICKEWTANERDTEFFPCLSKLTIINNKMLREAPLHYFSSSLKELTIHGCHCLILLENYIPRLPSLTHLELYAYEANITFDPLNMQLLEDLNLNDCSALKIERDLQSLTHLKRLTLVKCPKFFSKYSTRDKQKGKGLQVHRDEGLRSLTHIKADHSLLQHENYHLILGSLPSLQVLIFSEITWFTNIQILWFKKLTTLQEIHFTNCKFKHLPTSLVLLSSLKKMALISCTELESLSDSMPPNLQELTLMGCSQNLVELCEAYMDQGRLPVIRIEEIRKPLISDVIG